MGKAIKTLLSSDNRFSSKRLSALILIISGIIIPIISMFIDPKGVIDDSVLILSAQLLVSACGLLGFTLKDSMPTKSSKSPNLQPSDQSPRRKISSKDNSKLGSTNIEESRDNL